MTQHITLAHEQQHQSGVALRSAGVTGTPRHARPAQRGRPQATDAVAGSPAEAVMNSTIQVRDLETGETEVYTLVYPDHADVTENRISLQAPVGAAIYGRRVGDVVSVAVPSGQRRLRIEDVRFEPEPVT